jgi:hypothetical protein
MPEKPEEKVIGESSSGCKLVQVGTTQIPGFTDRLVKVMRPDGTYRSEAAVPLQWLLKHSEETWREPSTPSESRE